MLVSETKGGFGVELTSMLFFEGGRGTGGRYSSWMLGTLNGT